MSIQRERQSCVAFPIRWGVPQGSQLLTTLLLTLAAVALVAKADERRPFYNIAHMVNSIPEVDYYLRKGANALEIDVHFSTDGLAKMAFHGVPCDCFRRCMLRASFVDLLRHIRSLTEDGNRTVALLMLDLKVAELSKSAQTYAGADLVTKLVDHLWYQVEPERRVRVLVSIPQVDDKNVFKGLLAELERNANADDYRPLIGFDVGLNSHLAEIAAMYESLGLSERLWQGDGITNCLISMRSDVRLREAVDLRDAPKGYVHKVYHWTVDLTSALEDSLALGVDGIITNHPERAAALVRYTFAARYRMATADDSPWRKIMRVSKAGSLPRGRNMFFDVVVNFMELSQQALTYLSHLVGYR